MRLLRQLLSQPTTVLDVACGFGADLRMIELLLRQPQSRLRPEFENVKSCLDQLGRFDEDGSLKRLCKASCDMMFEAVHAVRAAGSLVRLEGPAERLTAQW